MIFKEYLKENKIKISDISRKSGIPYTTINEIANGKVDIDKVSIGTGIKLADVCGIEFSQLYDMCKINTDIPVIKNGQIIVKNKSYYLKYNVLGEKGQLYLCKVNSINSRFVKDMAEWSINDLKNDIKRKKEIQEVKAWTIDSI